MIFSRATFLTKLESGKLNQLGKTENNVVLITHGHVGVLGHFRYVVDLTETNETKKLIVKYFSMPKL